ncbi:MAG: GGDEF domain-containing protein, partial [Myxococcota bacterium]
KVLQAVSELFRSVLGPNDAICRYGGEEFCVLLGGADIARGAEVAERARAAVEGQTAVEFKVTCSFGVSSVRFGARNTEGMIDQADIALYASKKSGRNRVTRWDETEKYRASRSKRAARRAELPASKS